MTMTLFPHTFLLWSLYTFHRHSNIVLGPSDPDSGPLERLPASRDVKDASTHKDGGSNDATPIHRGSSRIWSGREEHEQKRDGDEAHGEGVDEVADGGRVSPVGWGKGDATQPPGDHSSDRGSVGKHEADEADRDDVLECDGGSAGDPGDH